MAQTGPSKDQPPSQTPSSSHVKTTTKFPGALGSGRAHLCLWLTAAVGLAADLISKQWAVSTIGNPDQIDFFDPATMLKPIVIIENYLRFNTVHNTGAVAGMAAGKTTLLVVASVAAVVFLLWLFATSRPSQWLTHIALGMLFAGALGNMYDRIFNQGKVIDFIEVNLHVWPANPWPTFNVADIFLCLGVVILLLTLLGSRAQSLPQKSSNTDQVN